MFNLKTLSAAVAAALLFSNVHAAGLGKLTVLSSLGQPLRAEIEVTSVSADEAGGLAVKLASVEAFQQANIDFNSALSTLRFAVEKRGGRQYVRVTSSQPLNEPFVDMLLELNGPNGRLVREYTFLLDPVDLNATQSAQVTQAPAPSPSSAPQRPVPTQQAAQVPESRPAPVDRAAPAKQQQAQPRPAEELQSEEYRVRKGDTLTRIAGQAKPSGVSLDQMLVALYRANPDAFIGQNMSRLKAGQILAMPSAEAARSISGAEARGIVVAQAADFNAYRRKLAGQVAAASPEKSADAKQSAGGKITAKVEEPPTPANEAKDKLKLSNAAPGAATTEDKIAREKAVAEANARVQELEKNVGDLQQLLEIKNKGLAEQQAQADAAKAEPQAADPAASAPAGAAGTGADAAQAKPPANPDEAPKAAPAVTPKAAAPAAVPSASEDSSFFDEVMSNPLVLPGLGALLVALGALGVIRARRQKQGKPFDDSILADSSLKANSLFGATGGQSVDTSNSMFNSSFAPEATHLDSNEVDPVAEADVYIAYGRDAQAEEILKEALRTQPDRHAVRVKLLEIYSNRKDLRAFEVLATELYGLTKGEGEDWSQAAAMGAAIDPSNPLYAGGKAATAEARDDFVAPTRPLEEQGLATLLASTHSDTSPVETIGTLDADSANVNEPEIEPEDSLTSANDALQETAQSEESAPEAPAAASNELDFDLDGIDLPDMVAPNTIPRPAAAESPAELASIDFDFLDEPSAAETDAAPESMPEQPAAEAAAAMTVQDLEFSLDDDIAAQLDSGAAEGEGELPAADAASLDFDLAGLDEPSPAKQTEPEAATETLDFDLSSINLDLPPQPGEPKPDAETPTSGQFDAAEDLSSASAEMATKLDLALAYRDIGDKEGARELLDEVLKGGTPEQSEKAKSLLLELV